MGFYYCILVHVYCYTLYPLILFSHAPTTICPLRVSAEVSVLPLLFPPKALPPHLGLPPSFMVSSLYLPTTPQG